MTHRLLGSPHPLQSIWCGLRDRIEKRGPLPPEASRREGRDEGNGDGLDLYLRIAERLVRSAAAWQSRFGAIIDPYLHHEASTCTQRFVGALGQLIGAGRCEDLLDACLKSYEYCLGAMSNPYTSPEFAIKELVLAHRALRSRVGPERLGAYEQHWRAYDAEGSFNCCVRNMDNNFNTFGLTGEHLRITERLGGDPALVDRLLEKELRNVDAFGMYHDPACPMAYHVVVMQQWSLLLLTGYRGTHCEEVSVAVRRAGLSSLLMQSIAAQAPFGGRSNQFHHNEAQSSALYEACAVLAKGDGDPVLAGCFKRAARRGVLLIASWILGMEPWRHIKQGFHPRLNHGTDSGGPYSIYGILTGSLCCMAAGVADPAIAEYETPAEAGGYVFEADPCFHRLFAAARGWSLQIDAKAQLTKDATGLGRVQALGLRPETILSGSIPAAPEYTFAFPLPQRNAAIGVEWQDGAGRTWRSADLSEEVRSWTLEPEGQSPECVAFRIRTAGSFGGVSAIIESFRIDAEGVHYSAALEPAPLVWRLTIPVIVTDGEADSVVVESPQELRVSYREDRFAVSVRGFSLARTDEINTNRNARYRTYLAKPEAGRAPGLHEPAELVFQR